MMILDLITVVLIKYSEYISFLFIIHPMFNLFRKIFTKEENPVGSLFIKNEEHKNVKMAFSQASLVLSQMDEPISIPFVDISDLEIKDKNLTFIHKETKFKFVSDDSAAFYERLKSFITQKFTFKAEDVEYFTYNLETKQFDLFGNLITVKIVENGKLYLRLEDDNVIHLEEIKTSTQYYMDKINYSFVWSVYDRSTFFTFCIKFKSKIDFLEFISKYVEASYKSVNPESCENVYFENMASVEIRPEESKSEAWAEPQLQADNPDLNASFDNDSTNKHLVIGQNQAFVTRGSSLGVFDVKADGVEFKTHIKNAFSNPEKILMHNGCSNLLILDKDQKSSLQIMDMNLGEVVEKWDLGSNVNDYFDSVKFDNTGTLIGTSECSIFRIDPRVKDKVVEKNVYKTKNDFSCGIATASGDVAIASKKGDLRLYNKISIRAKSLLPGFGDEVLGIDSCKDGSLILCTYKTYILVFQANTDYSKKLGSNKPTPRRLQLKPQHLALMTQEISFTPAKFDRDDSEIITSTGRYVLRWLVSDVLSSNVYNYSIRALYDTIIDENFVMDGNDIVVALPNDVKKISEKDLRKPGY